MNSDPLPTLPVAPEVAIQAFASGSDADASRSLAWTAPGELGIDLDDPAQRRFGDYELIERIGVGGMGAVYRARQHGLDREVALKFLAAGPWASDEFIARFRREARAAARMQHPNIVEIHDTGEREGLYYFSMRLVSGPSLAQRVSQHGPLPIREAAGLLRTIAEAIDYAHRLGVLHLDLKPANVLLGPHGEPLVADFGLARRIDEGPNAAEDIAGTPSYMAPEQASARQQPIGPAADLYGLGATLYELLVGEPPFRGKNAMDTLTRLLRDPPLPPRSRRREIPADLDAIVLKCLAKDPAARYASARALADDLGRFLDGRPVSVRPLTGMQRAWAWMRREPRIAALLGLVLISLTAGVLATSQQWQRAESALHLAETRRLQADSARVAAEVRAAELEQVGVLMIDAILDQDAVDSEAVAERAARTVQRLETLSAGNDAIAASILGRLVGLLDARLGPEASQSFLLPILEIYGARFRASIAEAWRTREGAEAALIAALWSRPEDLRVRQLLRGHPDYPRARNAAYAEAMRVALQRDPELLMSRYVDALYCAGAADACGDSGSARTLLKIAPENAAHYVLAAAAADSNAELREFLRQAATAPDYDDHYGDLFKLYLRGIRDSGVDLPEVVAGPIRRLSSSDPADFFVSYVEFQLRPAFRFDPFIRLCSAAAARSDPALHRDCVGFFQKAHASRGGMLHPNVGETMLRRLLDDPSRLEALQEERRHYQWMLECPGILEVVAGPAPLGWEQLMQDAVQLGERDAFFRRAQRLGCGEGPRAE